MQVLIGSDPEVALVDNTTGKYISADGLMPGTKKEPFKVARGAIQVDGMAAEFNTNPASSAGEFIFNHLSVLRSLRDTIKERNPGLDFSFAFTPVADFGSEYINSQSYEARQLGCTPDFNAYTGAPNPTPDADMPFRTFSGHIHLGWTKDQDIDDPEHIEACRMMVKQLDIMGALLIPSEGEDGKRRRELYGKAGAFRPKSYGVEYRTPSNTWLNDTGVMNKVYNNAHSAFTDLLAGARYYEMSHYKNIDAVINNHDVKGIRGLYGDISVANPWDVGLNTSKPVTMKTLDALYLEHSQFVNDLSDEEKHELAQLRKANKPKRKVKEVKLEADEFAEFLQALDVKVA